LLSLFLTHLEGYKKEALKSPILIILEVICELLLPLVMAEIVDVAIPSADVGYIFAMGALMLVLALLAMACGVGSAKYASFASQGFGGNLRQRLFDKVQEFSFADIDRFSSASLITRMTNDVNAMTMMLAMGLRMLVRAPVMLLAALGVSLYLNAKLAIVLLVIIPLMVLAIAVLMKICTRLFDLMQKKIDGLNNVLQENLVAIRVVKAFVREDHERKKFKTSNDELMMAGLDVGMKIVAIMPIMMLALNGATVAVLYLGGKMVMAGGFLLGDLQAFINYIFQILMSVMMVAMSLLQLSRAQACARQMLKQGGGSIVIASSVTGDIVADAGEAAYAMTKAALVGLNVLYGATKQVHVTEVRRLVETGAYIVDVRNPGEFEAGHLKGAHNIPLPQLRERLGEIPRDVPVYLHCRSSQRSYYALRILRGNGFGNVTNISGSFLGICLYEYFDDVDGKREPVVDRYNFN